MTLGNLVAAAMLVAYPLLALIFGALPWALWPVDRRLLLGVALVSAAAMIAGAATAVRLFPLTDLVVATFAAAGGIAAGRWFPPRARPMAIALALLAALDSIQVFAAGSAGPEQRSAFSLWTTFVFATPLGTTAIGFADLFVISGIAEHWRRRGAHLLVAVAPGVVSLLLVDLVSGLVYKGSLPLLPFVLAGWVLTELAVAIWRRRRGATSHAP
jgi:hypothetical protein